MVDIEKRIEEFIDRVRISQMGAKEEKFYYHGNSSTGSYYSVF